ncbi:MAG: BTAD domain-containing putative transcriptional regulator [Mycobacteriales bacterium]
MRPRLLTELASAGDRRLALVVAPAGSGKTTLLAQYAAQFPGAVAWYRAEPSDLTAAAMVRHVWRALADTGAVAEADLPENVDGLLTALAELPAPGLLLVVDDLHCLSGSPAEEALERLAVLAPPHLRVLVGSRRMPGFNLSCHELSNLTVVDAGQLRFRTWEVERLLRDVYDEPLPPSDVAMLARRTGGWAAGLQLFHLSTRGRSLAERRTAVASLTGRSPLSRAYLARTVLAELPAALREFLELTCVFDTLTAARCDALLETTGSQRRLEELVERQAFTVSHDQGRTFRYHEVLRRHLEVSLVERLGGGARQWYRRAAELLAAEGAYAEAARARAHAEDWPAVRQLLRKVGDAPAAANSNGDGDGDGDPDEPSWDRGWAEQADLAGLSWAEQSWTDLLPTWLVAEDPWLVLTEARRRLAAGRLEPAVAGFRAAERLFEDRRGQEWCRRERRLAELWLPAELPRLDWTDLLRAATRRHPAVTAGEATELGGSAGALVRLVSLVLSGNVDDAVRLAPDVDVHEQHGLAALAARLLHAALQPGGDPAVTAELERVLSHAEAGQHVWLVRMARLAIALRAAPADPVEAKAVWHECLSDGDGWGVVLATGLRALHDLHTGSPDVDMLADLVRRCRALDAGVLEAWAQALLAVASTTIGLPDAEVELRRAESAARSAGVPGARVLTLVAAARLEPARRAETLGRAKMLAEGCGFPVALLTALSGPAPVPAAEVAEPEPAVSVHCFGGFRLALDGKVLDWTPVKPRARTAMRLLALHAGRPVHREALVEALWPDTPLAAATRNLQVAVSSLRAFLEPGTGRRPRAGLLQRTGEAYVLAVPPGGYADVAAFESALRDWRVAKAGHDVAATAVALRAALAAYTGDLLPEDGPAEWVTTARETYRRQSADVAAALAKLELDDDPDAAVAAASRCVEIEPCHDSGWRLLASAYRRAGDLAAAERARRGYADVLASLGITPLEAVSPARRTPAQQLPPRDQPGLRTQTTA